MKLDPIYARRQYDMIKRVSTSNVPVFDKLVGKNGLSFVFRGVVNTLCVSATNLSTWKERVQYVLNNPDVSPGIDLITETDNLRKDLSSYFGHYQVPSEDDLTRSVRRLAKFIAFYSNTEIPADVKTLYEAIPSVSLANSMKLDDTDLIDNPTTRVPVVLCLDTSASMQGEKINELNLGVKRFFNAVKDDDIAKYSVELCIVTFNTIAKKILDFANIDRQVSAFEHITLEAFGSTAMGAAVKLSLELLEDRKKEYQDKGVDYWQPWLVLMTDGQPTDSTEESSQRVSEMVKNKKITIFPIGIGDGANMARLKQFSPKREPLKLKGLMLSEFFDWLGKSVKSTSQSAPGTAVKLPPIGWAEL
ncbi:vWA domain-containing protein [Prevotella melaninogenica]|jgi:von willebrand factor type A domain protein